MKIRMLASIIGTADGEAFGHFAKGLVYDLSHGPGELALARAFVRDGNAEEIGRPLPAPAEATPGVIAEPIAPSPETVDAQVPAPAPGAFVSRAERRRQGRR
jgi:hypothetical protein